MQESQVPAGDYVTVVRAKLHGENGELESMILLLLLFLLLLLLLFLLLVLLLLLHT